MAALANIITHIVNRETKKIPESALHICKVYKATSGAHVAINSVEHYDSMEKDGNKSSLDFLV